MECVLGADLCAALAWGLKWRPHLIEQLITGVSLDAIYKYSTIFFGLLSASLAISKWYRTRDGFIFEQLKKIVEKNKNILREDLSRSINNIYGRGADKAKVDRNLISIYLAKVFRTKYWDHIISEVNPETVTDMDLIRARQHIARDQKKISHWVDLADEQMFTILMVEAALASNRATKAKLQADQDGARKIALKKIDSALALPGKQFDLHALEMKSEQLLRQQRYAEAFQFIETARATIASHLERTDNSLEGVGALKYQRLRLVRMGAEAIYQEGGDGGSAENAADYMTSFRNADQVFNEKLSDYELFDRATFHEPHAILRSKAFRIAPGSVAAMSVGDAERDLGILEQQLRDEQPTQLRRTVEWLFAIKPRLPFKQFQERIESSRARLMPLHDQMIPKLGEPVQPQPMLT